MAEKKAQMGDFIGFSFNGIHSSELGLVRVSDGNRYEKNLFPAISDKTVQVPGRDGFYYFGSSYNTRELTIKVAFDNLEEKEFRTMVEHFKDKKPHFLWFDELPYKEYLVKIKSPPNFKYLCFDEWVEDLDDNGDYQYENGQIKMKKIRVYKGEGTIIFVCYSPYARARAKSLNETIDKVIVKHDDNWPDWFHNHYLNGNNYNDDGTSDDTSGETMREGFSSGYLELIDETNIEHPSRTLNDFYNKDEWEDLIYEYPIPETTPTLLEMINVGDIDMNTKILFYFDKTTSVKEVTVSLTEKTDGQVPPPQPLKTITINTEKLKEEITKREKDNEGYDFDYFFLESRTKLLRAYDNSDGTIDNNQYTEGNWNELKETNIVFNNCISGGDFFKIPADRVYYEIASSNNEAIRLLDIEYTYLYY